MKISAGAADAFLSLSRRRVRLPAPQSPAVESPLEHLLTRRSVSRDRVQASAAPQAAHHKSEDCVLFPETEVRELGGPPLALERRQWMGESLADDRRHVLC